jgi:hypothetical protein
LFWQKMMGSCTTDHEFRHLRAPLLFAIADSSVPVFYTHFLSSLLKPGMRSMGKILLRKYNVTQLPFTLQISRVSKYLLTFKLVLWIICHIKPYLSVGVEFAYETHGTHLRSDQS